MNDHCVLIFSRIIREQPRCIGLQVDAQTVLDYVHAHPLLAKTQVVRSSQFCFGRFVSINLRFLQILYGQSIGGAVAIDLAYRNPQAVRRILLALLHPSQHHGC